MTVTAVFRGLHGAFESQASQLRSRGLADTIVNRSLFYV